MLSNILVIGSLFLWSQAAVVPPSATLIVGGQDAVQGQFPYQVALYNTSGQFIGSGALIIVNEIQVVLTSAQCADVDTLVAGKLGVDSGTGLEQERKVAMYIPHSGYSSNYKYKDIALVVPVTPFQLDSNIQPVGLPQQDFIDPQGNITVSGWGTLNYGGPFSDKLQFAVIPVMDWLECFDSWLAAENYIVTPSQFCSVSQQASNAASPCTGDEGAPAVDLNAELVGLYSHSYNCGVDPLRPTRFTMVSWYLDWIHQQVYNYMVVNRDLF